MDSGSVSDFLRQIPPGFILMFCGSGILLVVAIVYIIRERAKRTQAMIAVATGAAPVEAAMSEGDLPDLDALASTETLKAAPPAPRSPGTARVKLVGGELVEAVEVMTVLRDVGEGGLIIRIANQAYRNPPATADAEFKQRFHTTLRDLGAPQPPKPVSEPVPDVVDEGAAPGEPSEMPPPPVDVPRFSPYEPMPGDLPKFKMPEGPPVKPKRGQRPANEPIPEINIAASIEAFLQHKLTMMPQYASRSIHVRPASNGGVTIEVDDKFYDSVGEVEDVAVRQFLSATIEEWQSRQ